MYGIPLTVTDLESYLKERHSTEQKTVTQGIVKEDGENVLVESDVPKDFVTTDTQRGLSVSE